MSRIVWDATGERQYEAGVSKGVVYPMSSSGTYPIGYAWNGLSAVNDSPDGAEAVNLWADNIKYGTLRSAENHKGSIEAYMYPDEFAECDGSAEPTPGLRIGQQQRKVFGFCYRTNIGNDSDADAGYKLHLVYGATASPSEKSHETVNESPDAMTFSWDYESLPVSVPGYKPTAHIELDSTKLDATKLAALESILYGTDPTTAEANDGVDPRLPLPNEVITALTPDAD